MQPPFILFVFVFMVLCYVSGEEYEGFELTNPTQPGKAKYFDDYGTLNTHVGQTFSASAFVQPSTSVLSELFRSYASTMRDLGVTTWLAHGTLLSWHWSRKVFPWETDIDMQIALPDLQFLARYYNMSVYQFEFADTPEGKLNQYLLDINPYHPERVVSRLDNNRIDARWVDMSNGAYIDITALHPYEPDAREKGRSLIWQTKDGFKYDDVDVYPLRRTAFEGVEAFVPNNARKLTAKEYTDESLTQTGFRGYEFDAAERQWIATSAGATTSTLKNAGSLRHHFYSTSAER